MQARGVLPHCRGGHTSHPQGGSAMLSCRPCWRVACGEMNTRRKPCLVLLRRTLPALHSGSSKLMTLQVSCSAIVMLVLHKRASSGSVILPPGLLAFAIKHPCSNIPQRKCSSSSSSSDRNEAFCLAHFVLGCMQVVQGDSVGAACMMSITSWLPWHSMQCGLSLLTCHTVVGVAVCGRSTFAT